ncbi:hypothetical protein GIB67_033591 [Kingdonia uniflora]|uniref:Cytochrome P450 n=1 Tax=Kingdonia uniflora TaxID=39325 RepID=A0A7J7LAB3_9MAGN|nr:hypothetical protein GIB67_033591 [Kingdonia uniflora]
MATTQLVLQWLELKGEIFFSPISLALVIFYFSVLVLRRYISRNKAEESKLPPSPPRLPIIGNLHQLGELAYRSFGDLSNKYGPVVFLYLGQAPAVVISSPELAIEVLKTQDLQFANRPFTTAAKALLYGCIDVGFAPYGEYWRQIRKICVVELLSIKRVQSFKSVREQEVSLMIEQISLLCSQQTPVNLSEMILTLSNDIVAMCALGTKGEGESGRDRLGKLSREVMRLLGVFSFGDFFPSFGWIDVFTGFVGTLKKVSKELDIFFEQVIEKHLVEQKKDDDKKDLLDLLLQAQVDNNLQRENIKAILMDMFVGGTDTTSTVIEWAIAELIRNPKVMKKTQEEVRRVVGRKSKVKEEDIHQLDYLNCVIKETLRLHPPGPTLAPRVASESTIINGYHIPPGTRLLVNVWAIQRDSNIWTNAEEFIPERFSNNPIDHKGQCYEYMPFGSGRRGCPGISFGLAVVEYVLANLLYSFDWELAGGGKMEELDMSETFGLAVHKKVPLQLIPKLYS